MGNHQFVGGILGMKKLPDLQSHHDTRGIPIDQVGITDLRYPIQVLDRAGNPLPTVAFISMSVHLPHHFKGTHMSRFLEVLTKHKGEVTMRTVPLILRDLKKTLDAKSVQIELKFPYFLTKPAPVSGALGKIGYNCTFADESNGRKDDFILGVSRSQPFARAAKKSAITALTTSAVTSRSVFAPAKKQTANGTSSGSRNSSQ